MPTINWLKQKFSYDNGNIAFNEIDYNLVKRDSIFISRKI
jgi:hypothetical protein